MSSHSGSDSVKTYIHLCLFIVFITWIRRWYLNACVPQFKIKNKLWGLYFLSFFKMFSETLALKKLSGQRSVSYSHPCPLYPPLRLVLHFYSQSTLPHPSASLSIPHLWDDFLRSYFPRTCLEWRLPKSNTPQESFMFMRAADGLEVSLWLTDWEN